MEREHTELRPVPVDHLSGDPICRSGAVMRQDRRVRFAPFAALVLIAAVGCSDDSGRQPLTCDEMRERISEIETTPGSGEQSWDAVLEGTDLAIERDALRAELASQGC